MKNILIADDSSFARRGLKKILETAGFEVQEARDGADAIEKYYVNKPDLVLLDLVMEGMDGFEVLKKLLQMDPEADVIIASADIQKSTEAEAMSLGAAAYIRKPFDPDNVVNTINKVFARGVS